MIAAALVVAVLVAALIGWLWWRGDGTLSPGSGEVIRAEEAALPADAFGDRATLLLFVSQQDDRSAGVRAAAGALAAQHDGVRVAEVDLTARGDLAGRWAVTRTPGVFALDADGRLRARVRGAADAEVLGRALDAALGGGRPA